MKQQQRPATRIREIRKARGYTLKVLADAIGTTPQTIQRLETATMNVSMTWLARIGNEFGLKPYELLPHPDTDVTPDRAFLNALANAVIHNRRAVPAIEDVLASLLESLGKLSGLNLECRKGLRPWDDAYEQALAVAAAAMRIGVDGRGLGKGAKLEKVA